MCDPFDDYIKRGIEIIQPRIDEVQKVLMSYKSMNTYQL